VSRAEAAEGDGSQSGTQYMSRKPRADDAERLAQLKTLPSDDEFPALLQDLTALSKGSQLVLKAFADDERKILERDDGSGFDPGLATPGGLDVKGIVSEVPGSVEEIGKPQYQLTDYGRKLARLLVGDGELSPANQEKLDEVRKVVEDSDRAMKELLE
jgi:hypothetical protein